MERDQLHDDNCLAYTSAAEDTGLTAFGEGRDQVNDFDAGLEDFHAGGLLGKGRG